jgi:hypothetical protein
MPMNWTADHVDVVIVGAGQAGPAGARTQQIPMDERAVEITAITACRDAGVGTTSQQGRAGKSSRVWPRAVLCPAGRARSRLSVQG